MINSNNDNTLYNKKKFFRSPPPKSPGRTFYFQGNFYNTVEPVFDFYLYKKGADPTDPKYNIKQKFSMYHIGHCFREMGAMTRDTAIGYTKEQVQLLNKKYRALVISSSLNGILEGNPVMRDDSKAVTQEEKDHVKLVMEVYQWILQYMSNHYKQDNIVDINLFLREMRERIPDEMKDKMSNGTTRMVEDGIIKRSWLQ